MFLLFGDPKFLGRGVIIVRDEETGAPMGLRVIHDGKPAEYRDIAGLSLDAAVDAVQAALAGRESPAEQQEEPDLPESRGAS